MARSTTWIRSWSPLLCLIFYFTAVSWLVPWNTALAVASPDPAAISPDIKHAEEDLSNDELHALLSLLAGTNSKVNPPDTILLSDSVTTAQTPVLLSPSIVTPLPRSTTTPSPPSTAATERVTSVATTTSVPPTTTKPRVIIVPVTPATTTTTTSDPKHNPRALASPPQNDLVQQLSLLNSLLGSQGGLGSLGVSQSQAPNGLDNTAAAEAAAALFGVAPAALIIPTTTSTTTTTTPRPATTAKPKPIGTLDDTSAALQSLALLNVLLGNTGENNSGNNSAAAALLGLGTASSSPAVRHTQSPAQKEQEAAAQLTNLLLQSAAAGGQANPQLQNFVNLPSNMDASASNQLSGLLGILGTLGSLGGQQQNPGLFNLGQSQAPQQQQQQANLLGNIFGGGQSHRQNAQAQQQASLLASLFGGNTTPAPSLPGFGILSSMANLGSTIFSTVTNTLGGSRGDGRPRVRGVDTRLGLGYRFGDNADAQLMWEIGPQLFTEPLKNEDANGNSRKRQAANGQGLLGSASSRVLQMFKPQSQYPQNHPNHNNPPWRRSDTVDESIVSKESLASVASSLPHQSLKTLNALLQMKKNFGTTPATTPEANKRSSLFSWYSSTTPTPRKIHIPAQQVGPPTSKFDMFNWFNKPSTTPVSPVVRIPSTQMTPPKSSTLDKFVSWYMGGSSVPSTTEAAATHNVDPFFFSPHENHDKMNIDPSNFLKRSSMRPNAPTARSMSRNYYDKRQINPKTNIHSSLTTYEKYLLGMLSDDDVNKSQDVDLMTSSTNNNNNAMFHQAQSNRRNNVFTQNNMRNGNNFSGERQHMGQQQRNNAMNFRRNHLVRPPPTNGPYLNRQPNNNPNFMPNRRPGIGNQFNFESHNKIVTMKGSPPPPRMRRPGSTAGPPGMPGMGMRRRFGPQRPPPQFSHRKTGFSFSSLNPFAGLFGRKNRPRNHFMNNQNHQQQYGPPMEQNYGMTEMSNIDSYNPYSAYDHESFHNANPPNNFDGNKNEQALANIRKLLADSNKAKKVSKEESSQVEDTPTADSNIQSTKVKYNPHQNFIPEAEDSYVRRNAIVTNPKLREAELEKLFGEVKAKNETKGTKQTPGQNNRKSDDYDSETESPSAYLMGLVKNVLNTRIKAKINNKEKNIPSISIITEKPILPRPKQKRPRIRTKLKITNGKPEIVVMPEPAKTEKPIVHVGEDMSFEDLKQFYDGVITTTKKPKAKKKKPKPKKTELVINDDDEIELSEEDDGSKDVFIDIDSGEVSVLKTVASLTSFDPPKEDSPEEEIVLDEETKRKQDIYNNLQKQLQSSYLKMKKAQMRAIAKQKRKEELAAKGLDESLDMVSKYFDLVEEDDKLDGKTHHNHMRQESQRHPYLSPPPPPRGFNKQNNDQQGYTSSSSYSQLRKNR